MSEKSLPPIDASAILSIIKHMMQNARFRKRRMTICRQKRNLQEMKLLKLH